MSQMRREVSQLHQDNESLMRANKLQGDFVSIASHELKTPLASIGAYAEALYGHADAPEFPERREFLGVIRHENDRLLRMVNRILDFSEVEFGNRSLTRRALLLQDVLDDTLRALAPQSTARNQHVEVDFPVAVPAVEVDERAAEMDLDEALETLAGEPSNEAGDASAEPVPPHEADAPAAEPAAVPVAEAPPEEPGLRPAEIDAIARAVVERLSAEVLREIAWEVVPDLAELMIRKKLEELG